MRRWDPFILCWLGMALVACGNRTPPGEVPPPLDPSDIPQEGKWTVETFATPQAVTVGEAVTVQCVVSQGRVHLTGVPTVVSILPQPTSAQTTPNGVTFVPGVAEVHHVACQTADQSVADVQGVTVNVLPGPPASVETTLATSVTEAGAPVAVACDLYDAFGNALEPKEQPGTLRVDAHRDIWIDPPLGSGFIVRGTLAGDYTVGCALDDLVDDTPEILTVVPGIPADTETWVASAELGPTQATSVGCSVTDAWGNPLEGYETRVQVLAKDGTTPGENGLTLVGNHVSATRAGTYYVACRVDGFFAADESPAEVVVRPGSPDHWIVELPGYTAGDCFWQNRPLPLLAIVYDAWGNVVEPTSYQLTVNSTAPGTVIVNNSIIISGEGEFDLDVCIQDHCTTTGGAIEPQTFAGLRLDSTPPAINITTPERASMMTSLSTITGQAVDGISALTSLRINGTAIALTPGAMSRSISLAAAPQWGLNVITGEAIDECGNRRVIAQSYLYSPQFYPSALSNNASSRVPSGVMAHLNQPVIDDFDSSPIDPSSSSYNPDLDDIASIGEAVLMSLDFNTLVPPNTYFVQNPLRTQCRFCDWWADYGYWVRRHSSASRFIDWAGPWILHLYANDNALSLGVRLDNFDFPLQANGSLRECLCGAQITQSTGTISGWAGADRLQATGSLGVSNTDSTISVSVDSMNINTTGLYIDIDCGWADFICDIITDLVVPLITGRIEDALEDAIASEIPPLVEGFLNSFGLDTGFILPEPLSIRLNLASGLDMLTFSGPQGTGNGKIGLYTQVFPSVRGSTIPLGVSTPGCCGSRGSIRRSSGTAPAFSSSQYDFGLALKDDVLNQLLWGLWYGGGLNLSLSQILSLAGDFNLDGVSMTLDARLPPVIMPGNGPNLVEIGLGDVYVDASVDLAQLLGGGSGAPPLNVGMYLSAVIGGGMDLDPTTNEIQLALDPNPTVHVEVVKIDDEGYQGVMTELFSGLLRLLMPRLLSQALASFPIPEFNLSSLGVPIPDTILSLTQGDLRRPNTSNTCLASGSPNLGATHFCMTGSLQ